jgi:hypothetical protein
MAFVAHRGVHPGEATLRRLHTNPGADVGVLGSYTLLAGKDNNRIHRGVAAKMIQREDLVIWNVRLLAH